MIRSSVLCPPSSRRDRLGRSFPSHGHQRSLPDSPLASSGQPAGGRSRSPDYYTDRPILQETVPHGW